MNKKMKTPVTLSLIDNDYLVNFKRFLGTLNQLVFYNTEQVGNYLLKVTHKNNALIFFHFLPLNWYDVLNVNAKHKSFKSFGHW